MPSQQQMMPDPVGDEEEVFPYKRTSTIFTGIFQVIFGITCISIQILNYNLVSGLEKERFDILEHLGQHELVETGFEPPGSRTLQYGGKEYVVNFEDLEFYRGCQPAKVLAGAWAGFGYLLGGLVGVSLCTTTRRRPHIVYVVMTGINMAVLVPALAIAAFIELYRMGQTRTGQEYPWTLVVTSLAEMSACLVAILLSCNIIKKKRSAGQAVPVPTDFGVYAVNSSITYVIIPGRTALCEEGHFFMGVHDMEVTPSDPPPPYSPPLHNVDKFT